jgi:hypothetical protein
MLAEWSCQREFMISCVPFALALTFSFSAYRRSSRVHESQIRLFPQVLMMVGLGHRSGQIAET